MFARRWRLLAPEDSAMTEDVQMLAKPNSAARMGIRLVKIATVYLVAGFVLGIVMGVSQDFRFMSVHAHTLLLGWLTMVATGLVYISLPACEENWLARVHYWGLNIGLPLMMAGLALLTTGSKVGEKIV